jgi:hypothetical protein
MSEKRSEDAPGRNSREDDDDIASRFPNVETDTRLNAPTDLPEPPKVTFQRPETRAARGEKPDPATDGDSVNLGRGGRIGGGEMRNAGMAATIGWSLAISIFVGAGLGYLVDRFLLGNPQTPWGLIIGFLVGTVSGFVNMVRLANQLNRDDRRDDR